MTDPLNDKPVEYRAVTVRFTLTVECEVEVEMPTPCPDWMTAQHIAEEAWEQETYRKIASYPPTGARVHRTR
jgi:hypothetical protein